MYNCPHCYLNICALRSESLFVCFFTCSLRAETHLDPDESTTEEGEVKAGRKITFAHPVDVIAHTVNSTCPIAQIAHPVNLIPTK